ncbi:hypothetical protein G9A89_010334 [Geosiphon pyriformis]|nr:hypothetical protein G9A89_010334 [Geosiphon pyriformis]
MRALSSQRNTLPFSLFPFCFFVISFNIPLFTAMELASFSASGSGSGSIGLGTQFGIRSKKHVEGIHSRGVLYKKPRKPEAAGRIVNSSAGPLSIGILGADGVEHKKSWGSNVESDGNSVNEISDMENLKNTVAEETSYVNSNVLNTDNIANNATPKITRTVTYILGQLPKSLAFDKMSDDEDAMVLPSPKFSGSKHLLAVELHVAENRNFEPVKLFVLDIEISAVPRKTNVDKLMAVKKIFYQIDRFGRALTPSKFPGIIRSSFTFEKSLIKTKKMAISEKILVNDNLRKVNSRSDQEVIVKEIPVDLLKLAIETVFSKFGKIISIKVQLIGLWQKALVEYDSSEIADLVAARWSVLMEKDSVRMAKASINKQTWVLLYTLPVGTTTHDLSGLVEAYGRRTCYIGCNPTSYVHDQCAVICFENEASKLAAIGSVLVFKGVSLHWAGLSLACCAVCKQFGHVSGVCSMGGNSGARSKWVVTSQNWVCLANVYKKKQTPIAHPVSFGGKTWAQVAGGSLSCVVPSGPSGVGVNFGAKSASVVSSPSVISGLCNRVVSLECFLELLMARVSAIVKKLGCVEVVSSVSSSLASHSVASASLASCVDLDMALNVLLATSPSLCPTIDNAGPDFGSSSSKVLTAKVGGLELKLMALDASVSSVLARLDMLCSGLGFSIATCNVRGMNVSAKQKDIVRWHKDMGNLVSIFTETKLKNRVFISGLDSGYLSAGMAVVMDSSLARHVCKVSEVPGQLLFVRLLFKNKLSVSILGLYAGASLVVRFSQADEINSLIARAVNESSFIVLGGDFNEDGSHKSASFKRCFDLGLVNSLVGSPAAKMPTWENSRGVKKTIDYVFVSLSLVNAIVHYEVLNVSGHFDTDYQAVSVDLGLGGLLDTHLNSLRKQVNRDYWKFNVKDANKAKWLEFKNASAVNVSMFSDAFGMAVRFHKLELLVSKLVKASCLASSDGFASLLEVWHRLNSPGASVVKSLFLSKSNFDLIRSALAKARKLYHSFKLLESRHTEESSIKQAISKRMESFELNKSHTIRSVLERPFHKVVLDYLVVEDELILEPGLVKSKMVSDLSGNWARQYWPLDYVFDNAFSDVMCSISFDELSAVVKNLPDRKKHCDKSVLDMLLVLLNFCLVGELIGSLACSTFDVLRGDNFSVLKGMTTQSPIFAISSVVEDALKKNRELWLVLQNMCKAYDSVGWEHLKRSLIRIKMCDRFIRFFGSIHNGRVNRVMTNFGLTDGYCDSVYDYRLNSYFISRTGWVDPQAGLSLFLAAGAFVNDTIWVGSSQAATQHILDVASKFFGFNNISVNNDKMVAIPINCQVLDPHLTISGAPISIAKKGESHHYLGIFLSSEVLRKAVSDKQCVYLVFAVLFPIISYKTQFNFVSVGICNKWDALVHKILKSKSGLPCDFPNDVLLHPLLYGLKTFEQIQAESKLASTVVFANSAGILGSLACAFCHWCSTPMSLVLGEFCFFKCVSSLRRYGIAFMEQLHDHNGNVFSWETFKCWKRLDPCGPVLFWFVFSIRFLGGVGPLSSNSSLVNGHAVSNIHLFHDFGVVHDALPTIDAAHLSVYTDGSLSGLGTVDVRTDAAIFFEDINLGLGVGMSGLVSSTLTELQVIALAFECVPFSRLIDLFSDSQAALDTCKSESLLRCHIVTIIRQKNLDVNWIKVKGYSGVLGNKRANVLAKDAAFSAWHLPYLVSKHFLCADDTVVSGNSRHFVCDVFQSVHRARWEIGVGSHVVDDSLHADINWFKSSMVWHPNSHLASGFISMRMAGCRTYFMKCLYDRRYSSVVYLFCSDVETLDHVFSCPQDAVGCARLLGTYASAWETLSGLSCSSSCVLQTLASCVSEVGVGVVLCKGFVFDEWFHELVSVFKDSKEGTKRIVSFVSFMEKHGLIPHDGSTPASVSGLPMVFLAGVVKLLGVAEAFGIGFGFRKFCPFFSGIEDLVSVHISI